MNHSLTKPHWVLIGSITLFCSIASASKFENLDMYELGKKVYTTGSESCQTCHGIDGTGTSRSKVNLTEPTSWKAFEYETVLKDTGVLMDSSAVAKAVIALGGRGWNERNFSKLRGHLSLPNKSPQPFDEDMVGLAGPNKKILVTHVQRLLRRSGLPKASPKEIEDLLSGSALTYIKEEFVK